ncbi:MAG: ABC transporter permease subunit [Lachnospiraceae bacterium]|nr:ABC transporter permease subunit [Lachnospiraceae bacterium]
MAKKVDPAIAKNLELLKASQRRSVKKRIWKYRGFYLMVLPIIVLAFVFNYIPMFGNVYAFTNYNGIKTSQPLLEYLQEHWVGFANFKKMFSTAEFVKAFGNTLFMSITKLLLNTVAAVIVSLFLNEILNIHFKKIAQTIIYLPHFLSWVVTASVFTMILSPTSAGLVNTVLVNLGIVEKGSEIYFLAKSNWWTFWFFMINLWKDTGWGTIIFLATLSGINPEIYEAGDIDGASRFQKMRYITLPALMNTIVIVLILDLAKVMNLFESVFVLQNDAVKISTNVLQTYVYYQTFQSATIANYGYTTAVGLAKSLVGCALVLICNWLSKKVRGRGII